MRRPRLVLLPGGKAQGDDEGQRSRADLQLIASEPGDELRRAIEQAVEAARLVRKEIEQRIAQALDTPPQP